MWIEIMHGGGGAKFHIQFLSQNCKIVLSPHILVKLMVWARDGATPTGCEWKTMVENNGQSHLDNQKIRSESKIGNRIVIVWDNGGYSPSTTPPELLSGAPFGLRVGWVIDRSLGGNLSFRSINDLYQLEIQ
jgi:hypothetical protein